VSKRLDEIEENFKNYTEGLAYNEFPFVALNYLITHCRALEKVYEAAKFDALDEDGEVYIVSREAISKLDEALKAAGGGD